MQAQHDPKWDIILQNNISREDAFIKCITSKEICVPGAQQLVKEITYDLETMFGDTPYTVHLVDGYGYNFNHHETHHATLWVVWWPIGEKQPRAWWMLLVRTDTLYNRLVRAAIVGCAGRTMMRIKERYPKDAEYGEMDQNEHVEEIIYALYRLYPHSAQARINACKKMAALWGIEINASALLILNRNYAFNVEHV